LTETLPASALFALWAAELPSIAGVEGDYRRLANEVMRLMVAQELFPFVSAKPVEARKTGRTNKTLIGARRQTILTSVL